MDLFVRIFKKA